MQLDADPLAQLVTVADRIQTHHPYLSRVGSAQALDALQKGRLSGAVGADDAEDLAALDVERHVVDGDDAAVRLT